MEPPATAWAVHRAAAEGDLPELRRLLAADPGLATAIGILGRTPLPVAAIEGKEDAVCLLLAAAPLTALTADATGRLPLHLAAEFGSTEAVRLLLEAAPAAALTADAHGWLPLHLAASIGSAGAVRLLLEAAPAAASTADNYGSLPLHEAAFYGRIESVRLVLKAAPTTVLAADLQGRLPLHEAAKRGSVEAVRLLLEAAPAAAAAEAHGMLPLEIALDSAMDDPDAINAILETARLLLPATPPEIVLSAAEAAGEVALPLFADLAACAALSPAQWQRVPAPCLGLGAALPAVLARSAAEAALLVVRLLAEMRQSLRIGALCLGRAQRRHRTELPAALVGRVLALAAGP